MSFTPQQREHVLRELRHLGRPALLDELAQICNEQIGQVHEVVRSLIDDGLLLSWPHQFGRMYALPQDAGKPVDRSAQRFTDTEAIALGRLLTLCHVDRRGLIAAEVERRWLLHYEFVRTGHGRQLRDRLPLIASVRRDVEAGLL